MSEITFFENNNILTGFEVKGHSGFAENGKDIVCAAVSSAAIMSANTVTDVMNLPAQVEQDDGYLKFTMRSDEAQMAQDILRGLEFHFNELSKVYPSNISIKHGGI